MASLTVEEREYYTTLHPLVQRQPNVMESLAQTVRSKIRKVKRGIVVKPMTHSQWQAAVTRAGGRIMTH